MLTRFLPFAGAFVLALGGLVTGCQDSQPISPQSSSTTTTTADPYAVYNTDVASLGDLSDVRSFDEIMNDPSLLAPPPGDPGRGGRGGDDTLHHGGDDTLHRGGGDTLHRGGDDTLHRGGDDSLHRGGRRGNDTAHRRPDTNQRRPDTTHRRPDSNQRRPAPPNLRAIIPQLHLSPAQDSQIKGCIRDLNDCLHSSEERYRNAMKDLRDALQADLREIRAAVENGRITAEEGRRLYNQKVAAYREAAQHLTDGFNRAQHECYVEFDHCVRSHLNREQIGIWERLFRF